MKHSRGFTLIELLVGIAVMALISIPLFDIIRGAFETFSRGTDTLILNANLHTTTPDLGRNLEYSRRIEDVSLNANKTGFLKYVDAEDRTITLFLNTDANQTRFSATNAYSENNIVVVYTESAINSLPEILVPDVTAFQIETYAHTAFSIASANNISTINVDDISSLQFSLDAENANAKDSAEFLVRLSRTPIENDGEHTYGIVGSPFSDLDFNGFSYSYIDTLLDGSGGEADGVYLLTPTLETVKIKNTGQYFSSIQDAVDAAISGDTIMVGYRAEGYVENIFINEKSNLTILGGYNSENWVRDPSKYPTYLINRGGFSIDDITAAMYIKNSDKIQVDTLDINGIDLRHALYVLSSDDISLSRLEVTSADRSVILSQSSVNFANSNVTGNEYALFVTSSDPALPNEPVIVERSRFFSHDITNRESTITLENAGSTVIRNSLILGGYNGVHANNSNAITILHSVIDLPENFGTFIQSCTNTTIQNSAICNGTIGLVIDPDDTGKTIEYNYYLNQQARASNPLALSKESNSYATSTYVPVDSWKAGNDFFEDILTYVPKTSSPTLADNGTGGTDLMTFSGVKGTSLPDIGIYGGQNGGRNGTGIIHQLVSTNTQAEILAAITDSWPGDTMVFESGTYTLSTPLSFKHNQSIMGAGPMDTVIKNTAGDILSLEPGSRISYMMLEGDKEDNGISLPNTGTAAVHNVVLKDLEYGIETPGASSILSFCTFFNTDVGVYHSGSAQTTVNLSIFAYTTTGIGNYGLNEISGYANLFQDTFAMTAGSYSSSEDQYFVAGNPLFWDESSGLLQLSPDSNAIDFTGTYDAGAFEFFEFYGTLTTPEYESDIPRDYDQIQIDVGGVSSLSAPMSQIEVAYELGGVSVTLSPTVIVSKDISFSQTWDLPPNVITEKLKLNVKMTSFTPGRTPYLNDLKVIW